ncbi:MAG: hypothetical protein JST04_10725 [Bdellovibrionales bacterium]|nr:hypothetical protein [Bdellovibrionales bacterium]
MGYAIHTNRLRALSIALLGLLLIGAGLASDANAAAGCTAEARKSSDGAYAGCVVKMGNREFTVSAAQSSPEGCSQVCSIMAEVGGASRGKESAKADLLGVRQ